MYDSCIFVAVQLFPSRVHIYHFTLLFGNFSLSKWVYKYLTNYKYNYHNFSLIKLPKKTVAQLY